MLDDNLMNELTIDDSAKKNLLTAAKWANFLAIVGFIGIGLMVIMALFVGTILKNAGVPDMGPFPMSNYSLMLSIIYIFIAVIYFFPIWYLFKFANNAKKAVLGTSQMAVSDAVLYLKKMFQFMGVFTAIIMSLYAVFFILGLGGSLLF